MTRVRVRGWWLLPLLAWGLFAAPWPAWVIEHGYARLAYPRIQTFITSLSNLTSLAVIDVALLVLSVWLGWRLVQSVGAGRARGWGSGLWELMRRLVRVAALLALIFLLVWGLNYRRVPLETTLGGAGDAIPADAMVSMARTAARSANALRDDASRYGTEYADIAARLQPAFQDGLHRLGFPSLAIAGRPKVSRVLTPFFTAAGVSGMINPIALESIVHRDLLPFERPMVLAHEWAHLAGFADEADASAIAWLACVTGDAGLAYSAHLFVVIETAGVLAPAQWRAIRASLAPGVVADLDALRLRLSRQQPAVRETAFKAYDGYLKSNRVDDGVQSYSRVLRVLLTSPMQAMMR